MTTLPSYHKKANGKLLLTGEYVVLDGATSLAVPTRFGQYLSVNPSDAFHWVARNHENEIWLEYHKADIISDAFIFQILQEIKVFEGIDFKAKFETKLDFSHSWGLGSSSTLVALLADYFQVNPYEINRKVFQGSGYDIACAFRDKPLLYSNIHNLFQPSVEEIELPENIKNAIYFVYLNQKQDSRKGILHYRSMNMERSSLIHEISELTTALCQQKNVEDWIWLLTKHEELISKTLQLETVKDLHFKNSPFFIKSLGAWGGDFVMIISEENPMEVKKYFNSKGYCTIFGYSEIIAN